jgi:hypothetical protein
MNIKYVHLRRRLFIHGPASGRNSVGFIGSGWKCDPVFIVGIRRANRCVSYSGEVGKIECGKRKGKGEEENGEEEAVHEQK